MFGYEHAELIGRPVESLVTVDLQAAHRGHRAAYAQAPRARPMGAGARLVALRKDGTTFPAEISLSPVRTATGAFTLTVIRDVTAARRLADLADLARAAGAQARLGQGLLDSVTASLYNVGLSLQAAADLPHDAARKGIAGNAPVPGRHHPRDPRQHIRHPAARELIAHPETVAGHAAPWAAQPLG